MIDGLVSRRYGCSSLRQRSHYGRTLQGGSVREYLRSRDKCESLSRSSTLASPVALNEAVDKIPTDFGGDLRIKSKCTTIAI